MNPVLKATIKTCLLFISLTLKHPVSMNSYHKKGKSYYFVIWVVFIFYFVLNLKGRSKLNSENILSFYYGKEVNHREKKDQRDNQEFIHIIWVATRKF